MTVVRNRGSYKALPALLIVGLLFLAPLLSTFFSDFSFSEFGAVLCSRYYRKIIGFTFKQAAQSALLSILLALPGAWITGRRTFKGQRLYSAVCRIPFVLPSILVVLGFVILLGNNGYLNRALMAVFNLSEPPLKILYSYKAIILAHAFYNFPLAISIIGDALLSADDTQEKAAAVDGASPLKIFMRLTLPEILPAVLSAFAVIFLYCFSSFAIILVLGGGPQYTTIEVEIYNLGKRAMDISGASYLAILSLCVNCLVLLIQSLIPQKRETFAYAEKRTEKVTVFGAFYLVLSSLFVILPLLSIVVRSFVGARGRSGGAVFSFSAYSALLRNPDALLNSFTIALCSGALAVFAVVLLALYLRNRRSRALEILCMLPMATSSVIIGLGYYCILRFAGNAVWVRWILIILSHCIIIIPFALRSILPVARAIPESLYDAASIQGASLFRCDLKIGLPMIKNSVLSAFCFGFAISMGEINATLMLIPTTVKLWPVLIFEAVNSYNYQGACAAGTLLMALCFLLFLPLSGRRD